jgi:Family of unknown function (DUF6508)
MKEAQPISKDQIKAIVRFLSIFKSEGFQFGHWTSEKGYFPYFTLSPDSHAFYKALYDNGWIVPFDWSSWQDEAVRYVNDVTLLEEADLETLRKLLTTHVRKDRFCEGHLDCMFACGHLSAILHRLQEICINSSN